MKYYKVNSELSYFRDEIVRGEIFRDDPDYILITPTTYISEKNIRSRMRSRSICLNRDQWPLSIYRLVPYEVL